MNQTNTMYCYMGELDDFGLRMQFEIVGDDLRIFYAQINRKYKEKVVKVAYYQQMMDQLNDWMNETLRPK